MTTGTTMIDRKIVDAVTLDNRRGRLPAEVTLAMPPGYPPGYPMGDSLTAASGRAAAGIASPLAQAIVDAIREPVLALDGALRVVTANRAFCLTFGLKREAVLGCPLQALGDGAWDIPELRELLNGMLLRHSEIKAYEVERDFSGLGRRTMLLNAHEVACPENAAARILLTFEDITERRAAERALNELVHEKDLLLQEIPHRVATCLQIIASVLRSRARTAGSDETRRHLEDAHNHVMTLSALQRQLRAAEPDATVEVGHYLSRLCETLATPAAGCGRSVSLQVQAAPGAVSSDQAVSIGLVVTELVVNALEYAFPEEQDDAVVIVAYDQAGPDWTLTVRDNGSGRPEAERDETYPGLGTRIIEALLRRLDASLEVAMDTLGTTVSVSHGATFAPRPPRGHPNRAGDHAPAP